MTKRITAGKRRRAVAEFYKDLRRGDKTKTFIYQDLALKYGVESGRTIQRWIDDGRKRGNLTQALQDEAYAKCTKGDHSWFTDSRFEGLAYRCKPSYEVNPLGNIEARYFMKTCYFCGYSQSEFIF